MYFGGVVHHPLAEGDGEAHQVARQFLVSVDAPSVVKLEHGCQLFRSGEPELFEVAHFELKQK